MSIHKIVLTGGPCGGKSSLLAKAMEELPKHGIKAILCPEAATDLICQMGISCGNYFADNRIFQECIIKKQINNEDLAVLFAQAQSSMQKTDRPIVILCDRGLLDGRAFMKENEAEMNELLAQYLHCQPFEAVGLAMNRYDAVIHVVSAACGAEEAYNLETNPARIETASEARQRDFDCFHSWNGHPHIQFLDNSTSFEEKMQKGIKTICNVVGVPEPMELEYKFLVQPIDNCVPSEYQPVVATITQIYLVPLHDHPEAECRVRKRSIDGIDTYFYTEKKVLCPDSEASSSPLTRIEKEKVISKKDYEFYSSTLADPHMDIIRKTRYCFRYNDQYMELDHFHSTSEDHWILEVEKDSPVELPPFLQLIKNITDDSSYTNYSIAQNGWPEK